ncbi:hypothetical protein WBJ53_26180 [Spirosoma sp. SC4-14]|uniref:hypothetical protein n=1 Tax=Spirosoma sp. SC4-14 TaxID=3128900 RepID=UPI0030D329E7
MKHLLFFFLLLGSSMGLAQSVETDPTKRVHKDFRSAGQMGLSERNYSQADSLKVQTMYVKVIVDNKAQANAQASGTQPKIIIVLVDESDGNRKNKYIYDGDNQPLGYPLF